jgi:hypothetical protein
MTASSFIIIIIGILFYNTFSVAKLYSVDDRVISNDDELERIW